MNKFKTSNYNYSSSNTTTNEQWEQLCQDMTSVLDQQPEFVDSTTVKNTNSFVISSTGHSLSPTTPDSTAINNILLPNTNHNSKNSKPTRRRSRASKRTPTTILTANTTNFRSLVQQFTGCPATSLSFGSTRQKGPVNLSFSGLAYQGDVVPNEAPSGYEGHSSGVQAVQPQVARQQQLQQGQFGGDTSLLISSINNEVIINNSSNNNNSNVVFASTSTSPSLSHSTNNLMYSMDDMLDAFPMINDFAFQE